jgi:hypothetical protein
MWVKETLISLRTSNWKFSRYTPPCVSFSTGLDKLEVNIDIASLHWPICKDNDVCPTASLAITQFNKPVIIDDDGVGGNPRQNDDTVLDWASKMKGCASLGKVHFDPLDGGIIFTTTCGGSCTENNECMVERWISRGMSNRAV